MYLCLDILVNVDEIVLLLLLLLLLTESHLNVPHQSAPFSTTSQSKSSVGV